MQAFRAYSNTLIETLCLISIFLIHKTNCFLYLLLTFAWMDLKQWDAKKVKIFNFGCLANGKTQKGTVNLLFKLTTAIFLNSAY